MQIALKGDHHVFEASITERPESLTQSFATRIALELVLEEYASTIPHLDDEPDRSDGPSLNPTDA